MVREETTNNRTVGRDTNHTTMFTLLLKLNVITQSYMWTTVDTVRIAK